MTTCTEARELLKQLANDLTIDAARLPSIYTTRLESLRAFLAQDTSCDAREAVLVGALVALEWLPEEEGDWAECPCCGALKMNGHIPDGCQLADALADTSPAAAALLARAKALDAAWSFLWHTTNCISVVGQVASGHPCDCGFTKMIELVKEARGQACP